MRKFSAGLAIAMLTVSSVALAAPAMDPDFAAKVKEWTTRPEFNSPLTDHLPLSATIPSPVKHFGDHIGKPGKLHYQREIVGYYRALAAADPARVKIVEIGKTNEGRDNIVVFISSAANIANLQTTKANLARLADPRTLSEDEAKRLIESTRPIYHLSAGLHSAETGPPEMAMEMAYRLLAEDNEMTNRILENVVVAFSPVLEGDGRDRYVDWYYRHLTDITDDLQDASRPPYWGKYIYHDNNRDINFSDPSAKQLLDYFLEWHPPIMHDMHESIPFLYTYSGQSPQNPDLDPILYGELPWIANYEVAQLTKYGMPGVWTHGFMDAWSPGYLVQVSQNHNGMLRMYETFNNWGANTTKRHIQDPNAPHDGPKGGMAEPFKREWYRANPPYKETMWSMRNNVNYMQTAALSALDLVAAKPQVIVENFYRKSRNALSEGQTKPPYAYVIPGGQADPTRVRWLTDRLRDQGIEVGRLNAPLTVKEGKYPAGSLIIKLNQPYGRLAKTLLRTHKDYPDERIGTYDDTGWTMGLMTGTEVVPIADKAALDAATTAVDRYTVTPSVGGNGRVWVVPDNGAVAMATLRFALKDADVQVAEAAFTAGGRKAAPGSFIISGTGAERVPQLARELGLDAVGVGAAPQVARHTATFPRIALYSTWGRTEQVGWWRYAMDQHKVPYTLIFKEQVRAGNLKNQFDVILIPSQGRSAQEVVFDIPMTGKPLPYNKTAQYQFMGDYGSSDDIRGGMGLAGLAEIQKFAEDGGTLITTGHASSVVSTFNLMPYITSGGPRGDFYAPGPIVNMTVKQGKSPIFYGYSGTTLPVRWATNTLFSVPVQHAGDVLARFPGGKANVVSGLMRGADSVKETAAIVERPVGKGRVVMFATNPVWRWQTYGEFRMVYNALINHDKLDMGKDPVPVAASEEKAVGHD